MITALRNFHSTKLIKGFAIFRVDFWSEFLTRVRLLSATVTLQMVKSIFHVGVCEKWASLINPRHRAERIKGDIVIFFRLCIFSCFYVFLKFTLHYLSYHFNEMCVCVCVIWRQWVEYKLLIMQLIWSQTHTKNKLLKIVWCKIHRIEQKQWTHLSASGWRTKYYPFSKATQPN